jgi:hypothetical protein
MTVAQLPLNFQNLKFIVWVGFNRLRIRYSSNPHPFDSHFLSGDAFRSLADHVYEGREVFDPSQVQKNDLVFVNLNVIEKYLQETHPKIGNPYRLLSHNGDTNITKKFTKYIDKKMLVWWTQNCLIEHPKVKALPIGLENMSYLNHGIPSLYHQSKKKKKSEVLYGFSISTNPNARTKAMETLRKMTVARSVPNRLNSIEYSKVLNTYMFVASPPGNGEDCIRTWEAMYLDVIPIVLRSPLTTQFEKLKLPVLVIDEWKMLEHYTPELLQRKYDSIIKKSDRKPLHFEYWAARILHTYGK